MNNHQHIKSNRILKYPNHPKMPKSVNFGGQRRTAELGCGFTIRGHPNEVNKRTEIHMRHCAVCKASNITIPEYNKTNADINGWSGLNGCGRLGHNQEQVATYQVKGQQYDATTHKKGWLEFETLDDIPSEYDMNEIRKIMCAIANDTLNPIKKQKPNEKCACGSGKKFKKCCGEDL